MIAIDTRITIVRQTTTIMIAVLCWSLSSSPPIRKMQQLKHRHSHDPSANDYATLMNYLVLNKSSSQNFHTVWYSPSAMLHLHTQVNLNNCWEKGCGTCFAHEYPSSQVLQQYSQTKWVPFPFTQQWFNQKQIDLCKWDDVSFERYILHTYIHLMYWLCFKLQVHQ